MDKLNPKLIEKCNDRIAEKESIYGGEDNPKNWRNMFEPDLMDLVGEDYDKLNYFIDDETPIEISTEEAQLLCVDMINRLGMIWEKLNQ